MIGNKEGSFADLKKGPHVVVDYKKEGSKLMAVTIIEAVLKADRSK